MEDFVKINEDIAQTIIDKKFKFEQLRNGQPQVIERVPGEKLVEETKEFKGIITDMVTTDFLKTTEQTKEFLKVIFSSFDIALKKYKQAKGLGDNTIYFLYKGGNILRFIAKESMNQLPGYVSERIMNYYKDSFKKSDADFTIYIDVKLPNFDEVRDDIVLLTYLLENNIRNIFLADPVKYFEFYRLSLGAKKDILKGYVDKLNATETVKGKLHGYDGTFNGLVMGNYRYFSGDNIRGDAEYIPKPDKEMDYVEKGETKEIVNLWNLKPLHLSEADPKIAGNEKDVYKGRKTTEMYISANKTLTFKGLSGSMTSFVLVRTKVSVNAYFGDDNRLVDLDGELIDITIPNKDDGGLNHFWEHSKRYLGTYKIGEGDNVLIFDAYSLEYLIDDLEALLFDGSQFPWDDSKYMKRIKRLLYMYFLLLLTRNMDNNERKKYLVMVKRNLVDPIKEYMGKQNGDYVPILAKLYDFLKVMKSENVKQYPFKRMIKNLAKLLINSGLDRDKLNEYLVLINENFDVMFQSLNDLESYISNSGTIKESSLYQSGQIGGKSYQEKYRKYKTKYLNKKYYQR